MFPYSVLEVGCAGTGSRHSKGIPGEVDNHLVTQLSVRQAPNLEL